jgi:hypothetical protein
MLILDSDIEPLSALLAREPTDLLYIDQRNHSSRNRTRFVLVVVIVDNVIVEVVHKVSLSPNVHSMSQSFGLFLEQDTLHAY